MLTSAICLMVTLPCPTREMHALLRDLFLRTRTHPVPQHREVHRVGHCLITGGAGVNVVAGLITFTKLARPVRIAHRRSKSITPSNAPLLRIHWFTACRVASPSSLK